MNQNFCSFKLIYAFIERIDRLKYTKFDNANETGKKSRFNLKICSTRFRFVFGAFGFDE